MSSLISVVYSLTYLCVDPSSWFSLPKHEAVTLSKLDLLRVQADRQAKQAEHEASLHEETTQQLLRHALASSNSNDKQFTDRFQHLPDLFKSRLKPLLGQMPAAKPTVCPPTLANVSITPHHGSCHTSLLVIEFDVVGLKLESGHLTTAAVSKHDQLLLCFSTVEPLKAIGNRVLSVVPPSHSHALTSRLNILVRASSSNGEWTQNFAFVHTLHPSPPSSWTSLRGSGMSLLPCMLVSTHTDSLESFLSCVEKFDFCTLSDDETAPDWLVVESSASSLYKGADMHLKLSVFVSDLGNIDICFVCPKSWSGRVAVAISSQDMCDGACALVNELGFEHDNAAAPSLVNAVLANLQR